jgi:uncharacterized protein YutE (UPF0331/DUF86 family)
LVESGVKMGANGIIERKLALLDDYHRHLEECCKNTDLESFCRDWALQRTVERALQVMAEIIIDVSERLISMERRGPVASSTEAIETLEKMGIIVSAKRYIPIIRFRNLVVHQYEQIKAEILFDIAKNHMEDFRHFRDEIDRER